jgi:hypothetical protein
MQVGHASWQAAVMVGGTPAQKTLFQQIGTPTNQ